MKCTAPPCFILYAARGSDAAHIWFRITLVHVNHMLTLVYMAKLVAQK